MRRFTLALTAAATVAAGSLVSGLAATSAAAAPSETAPKHIFSVRQKPQPTTYGKTGGSRTRTSNGIGYHGGPIISGTTHAYYIWYGDWSGKTAQSSNPTAQSILNNLASKIGGSPYFNINTTYYDSTAHVTNAVNYARSAPAGIWLGTSLSDADVQAIVSDAITSGGLPNDANGVYFVLTSADVDETSGFLTQYCGWHTHGTIAGSDIKYSFVGDPARNYSACSAQSNSPNGNQSADAMASVIAHELEEAVTDPDLDAWYDQRGYENADKCAWTFGTTKTTSNGAKYNMTLGGTNYLIQRNWVNASGGYCSLTYP